MISNHRPGNYWYWAMLDENIIIIIATRIETRNLSHQTGTDAYKAIYSNTVYCLCSVLCLFAACEQQIERNCCWLLFIFSHNCYELVTVFWIGRGWWEPLGIISSHFIEVLLVLMIGSCILFWSPDWLVSLELLSVLRISQCIVVCSYRR